jgi:hypothetical protein
MMFVVAETILILILEVRGKFDIFGLCCPEALFVGPYCIFARCCVGGSGTKQERQ